MILTKKEDFKILGGGVRSSQTNIVVSSDFSEISILNNSKHFFLQLKFDGKKAINILIRCKKHK